MPPAPPPRLWVLFARDAPRALVLRRGPAAWFHLVAWDTARDRFTPGAWLKGRLYPERCDLSPDGQLLLAFVHQGRRARGPSTQAWTALSRSPWLHALALWPQGTTYGGGGRFEGPREVVLPGSPRRALDGATPGGLTVRFEPRARLPPPSRPPPDLPGVTWAGHDQRGRLVVAREGCLRWRLEDGEERLLIDLRAGTPEPRPAPASARRRLG